MTMPEYDVTEQEQQGRVPPNSLDAEQSVLGALLLDDDAWDAVAERLVDRDFYRHDHRVIYRAIVELRKQEQPIDIVTVAEELEDRGEIEKAGGRQYLSFLSHSVVSADNSAAYADIVRERAQQRRLIAAATEIIEKAYEPGEADAQTLISDAENAIAKIGEGHDADSGPQRIKDIMKQTVAHMQELFHQKDGLSGLTSGFIDIDARTSGWQKADLVIVAARPSMGKTTYAMNLVENALLSAEKVPCVVFSMEMPAEAIAMRMLSSQARVDQTKVRSGKLNHEEWKLITSAAASFFERPLYIDDTPALTPTEMRARVRKIYRECDHQMGLIMVDYLQLMRVSGPSEGRTQEISEISRSLKALAKEFNCPVIALSQLNRSLEQRPNKRPVMSDLRESGAIEQDADIIQFIYRDEVYNEDSEHKGIAEIITGKHRNGPIGVDRLNFYGKFTRFEDLANQQYYSNDDDE